MIRDCLQSLESEFQSVIESPQKTETEDATELVSERDGTIKQNLEGSNKDCKEQSEMRDTKHDGNEKDGERGSEKEDRVICKSEGDRVMAHVDCLLQGVKSRIYKPLLKRDKCCK